MGSAGTFELVGLSAGQLLRSLVEALTVAPDDTVPGSRAGAFFGEMGLAFPSGLDDLANEISGLTGLVGDILELTSTLAAAIEVDDGIAIGAEGAQLVGKVVEFYDELNAVRSGLIALGEATTGIPDARLQEFFDETFATRFLGHLLSRHFTDNAPVIGRLLSLTGIIETEQRPGNPSNDYDTSFEFHRLRLDRIGRLLTAPEAHFEAIYDWGGTFDSGAQEALLDLLASSLRTLQIPALALPAGGGDPPMLQTALFDATANADGLDVVTGAPIRGGLGLSFPFGPDGVIDIVTEGLYPRGLEVDVRPVFDLTIRRSDGQPVEGRLTALLEYAPEERPLILGVGGMRLDARAVQAEASLRSTWNATAGSASGELIAAISLVDGRFAVGGDDAGGFLAAILPGSGVSVNFEVGVGFSSRTGLFVQGGAALELTLALAQRLGPVNLEALTIALRPADDGLAIEAGLDLGLEVGPAFLSLRRFGLTTELDFDGGNFGLFDLGLGFKPPSGIDLAVDLPPVLGGGSLDLDPDSGEYSGAIQLAVADTFDIKAVGLVAELPSGDFAILAIGSVEFLPPIQLFAGFGLGGVGLLVGIHRAMDADALRAGVKEGNLDAILFPQDPIRNASRIVNSLAKFFPPTQDTYVFGALGLITWGAGGFFELKVGVALEVPHHLKLLVAAILDITLSPGRGEVLRLRADVLGLFDLGTGEITVDGSLFDSQVNGFLVSGDSAFRNKSTRGFIMTAGGFHPAFDPPAELAQLERLAIGFAAGPIKLRVEGYFAITSNTVQAGARAELRARAAGFGLEGSMSIDMLFQFDPFRVRIDFSARVAIKAGGSTIMSLTLNATLDGFTPTKISGRVSFKILFIRIRIPVSLTFGRRSERTFDTVDVLAQLLPALREARNWATDLDRVDSQAVSLREPAEPLPDGGFLVHPLAPLSVRQQLVPLDVEIELFKSARPQGDQREFSVTTVELGSGAQVTEVGPERRVGLEDKFAPAQYFEYTDDEKLSSPSFEEMESGVRITTTELDFGLEDDVTMRVMQYEQIVLDREQDEWIAADELEARYTMLLQLLLYLAALSSQGRQVRAMRPAQFYPRGQKVTVKPQRYVVAKRAEDSLEAATEIEGVAEDGTSHSKAMVSLKKHEAANYGFLFRNANTYGVVGFHELPEAS